MRKPSGRILINRVDIYLPIPGRNGAGVEYRYAETPDYADVPCSVQAQQQVADVDGLARLSQVNTYDVMFATDYAPPIRSKLVWTDSSGTQHPLLVETSKDNAGRGAAFTVTCVEIV